MTLERIMFLNPTPSKPRLSPAATIDVNPTRGILFAHRAFDVALSPPRFPAHWLPFASFLIRLFSCFGVVVLAAVWEDFFSIDFKRALLFVFFPRPAPNYDE